MLSQTGIGSVQRVAYNSVLIIITAVLTWTAIMIPVFSRWSAPAIEINLVADQDYIAPEAIVFPSEVLTNKEKDSAARAVLPRYTSPDTSVARKQLETLQISLAFITNVYSDPYATLEQKKQDLSKLEQITLPPSYIDRILAISDQSWEMVQQESQSVLEEIMRSTIRPNQVQEAKDRIRNLISFSLTDEQIDLVELFVVGMVVPNSLYSEEITEQARQVARDSVETINRSFATGETVVSRGQVISEEDIEALQYLGLAQPKREWQEAVSATGLTVLFIGLFVFYLIRRKELIPAPRSILLLVVFFLLFLFVGRSIIPGHTIFPYAFPIAAFGLLITALFNSELAIMASLPLAIFTAYGLPQELTLIVFYFVTSLFGILGIGNARKIISFFRAGLAIFIAGSLVILAFRLTQPTADFTGIITLIGVSLVNGLAAASGTLLLQFFLAQFLGLTTPMQLLELSRPDHPLLQIILRDAPGTYQHSLQVANLAEQAAERVGANPLLSRVGALYHDIGKVQNAGFFIENQVPGYTNPHHDLDPHSSASTIIQHVLDGLGLARKYRLPEKISAFIPEHHGTMLTRYQYSKAVTVAGGDESLVDKERFRYPGPKPQSKETAILMLADGSEARVRSQRPSSEDELRELVQDEINNRLANHQLDETDLTLKDLKIIGESFTATLKGVYHPRIKYPELDEPEEENPKLISPEPENGPDKDRDDSSSLF